MQNEECRMKNNNRTFVLHSAFFILATVEYDGRKSFRSDFQHFDEVRDGEDLMNCGRNIHEQESAPTVAKLPIQDDKRAEAFRTREPDATQVEMKDGSAQLFKALPDVLETLFGQHFMAEP
jgi:hypothetical protein